MSILFRIGFCVALIGLYLYSYLDLQNRVTELKMALPEKEKEIRLVLEENRRLSYEIDRFESPSNLIELVSRPEYAHLKHPLLKEILTVPEAFAASEP